MMQDALHDTANSRYLLSFGSRQSLISSLTVIRVPSAISFWRKTSRFSIETYLSNLLLDKVSAYSCNTGSENASVPDDNILFKANIGF